MELGPFRRSDRHSFLILGNGLISKALQKLLLAKAIPFKVLKGRTILERGSQAISSIEFELKTQNHTGVFSLFGFSNRLFCSDNPIISRKMNVELPSQIASLCHDKNIPYIFVSSAAVFGGKERFVPLSQGYAPSDEYGLQKMEAEMLILEKENSSILRFGKVWNTDPDILVTWKNSLASGRTIKTYENVYVSPIRADEAAEALLRSLEYKSEVMQLSAAYEVSYSDIADSIVHQLEFQGLSVSRNLILRDTVGNFPLFESLESSRPLTSLMSRVWKIEKYLS